MRLILKLVTFVAPTQDTNCDWASSWRHRGPNVAKSTGAFGPDRAGPGTKPLRHGLSLPLIVVFLMAQCALCSLHTSTVLADAESGEAGLGRRFLYGIRIGTCAPGGVLRGSAVPGTMLPKAVGDHRLSRYRCLDAGSIWLAETAKLHPRSSFPTAGPPTSTAKLKRPVSLAILLDRHCPDT